MNQHLPTSLRRGFTLIEVVLATVLGALVLIAAGALFGAIENEKARQSRRLENTMEFATAHKTIAQAMRSLLMTSGQKPGSDRDLKTRIQSDISSAKGDDAYLRSDDAAEARLALQPDLSHRGENGVPAQVLELTLRTPPILGLTQPAPELVEEQQQLAEIQRLRAGDTKSLRAALDRQDAKRDSASAAKSSKSSSAATASANSERNPRDPKADRSSRLRDLSGSFAGKAADDNSISKLVSGSGTFDAPRAPGLRAVFEIRAEDDPKILARAALSPPSSGDGVGSGSFGAGSSGAWALWYREIPIDDTLTSPDDSASTDNSTDRSDRTDSTLLDLARFSRTDGKQIKLLSGLSEISWRAYRRREWVGKMTAKFAEELPAYVELSLKTIDGREERWMFEVSWSYGSEPGSVLATGPDALDAGDAAIAAGGANDPNNPDLQAILAAVQNGTAGGANGTSAGSTTAPGTRPTTGPTKPGTTITAGGITITIGPDGRPIISGLPQQGGTGAGGRSGENR